MTDQTTIISGPITLTWRGKELYAGRIYIGEVQNSTGADWLLRVTSVDRAWQACAMTDTDFPTVSWFATEDDARSALVEAVTKALKGES